MAERAWQARGVYAPDYLNRNGPAIPLAGAPALVFDEDRDRAYVRHCLKQRGFPRIAYLPGGQPVTVSPR